eukprot:804631_1
MKVSSLLCIITCMILPSVNARRNRKRSTNTPAPQNEPFLSDLVSQTGTPTRTPVETITTRKKRNRRNRVSQTGTPTRTPVETITTRKKRNRRNRVSQTGTPTRTPVEPITTRKKRNRRNRVSTEITSDPTPEVVTIASAADETEAVPSLAPTAVQTIAKKSKRSRRNSVTDEATSNPTPMASVTDETVPDAASISPTSSPVETIVTENKRSKRNQRDTVADGIASATESNITSPFLQNGGFLDFFTQIKTALTPTHAPTLPPTDEPTNEPTLPPTKAPTDKPTNKPTDTITTRKKRNRRNRVNLPRNRPLNQQNQHLSRLVLLFLDRTH